MGIYDNIQELTKQVEALKKTLASLLEDKKAYQRILSVPGVGPTVAATLLASINGIHAFKNGRQFADWVGLTPAQYASGDKSRMGGITKRGNQSIRKMLILGARAVLNWCEKTDDNLRRWLPLPINSPELSGWYWQKRSSLMSKKPVHSTKHIL